MDVAAYAERIKHEAFGGMFGEAKADQIHLLEEIPACGYAYSLEEVLVDWAHTRNLPNRLAVEEFKDRLPVVGKDELVVRFLLFAGHFAKHFVGSHSAADG